MKYLQMSLLRLKQGQRVVESVILDPVAVAVEAIPVAVAEVVEIDQIDRIPGREVWGRGRGGLD